MPMPLLEPIAVDSPRAFVTLFAVVYATMLSFYLLFGALVAGLAGLFPDRRIQPHRNGYRRALRDIGHSAKSLLATAACFTLALSVSSLGLSLFDPAATPLWAIPLLMGVFLVLYDTWFYWLHRAFHTPALYRFHRLHHRSVAPTAWSNDSFTMVEAGATQFFFVLGAILLPLPPIALIGLKLVDQVKGTLGHLGFEFVASSATRFPFPFVCTLFHDVHHSRCNYNFADSFTLWDRLCGTLDPQYDRAVERWETGGRGAEREPATVRTATAGDVAPRPSDEGRLGRV